jgi:3-oxoacyl-[acyl-carrier-protein] synthase III
MFRSVITGTGSYIPPVVQLNEAFIDHSFFNESGQLLADPSSTIIKKFEQITGIAERRYAPNDMTASGIAAIAAQQAIEDCKIDPESLDQIIVSHNFGDVKHRAIQMQAVPSLANRVKHLLGIQNPSCIAYDILFGCPGWVQSVIQTDAYFKAGMAKKALLVGTETLSRVIDSHDRDSMIFSDGAGACIMEYREVEEDDGPGILGSSAQTHSIDEAWYICMGKSYSANGDNTEYIKMNGRKVYEYAMKHVPTAMKDCLDKSGVSIDQLKKVFIHQANEKMDEGIIKRLYQLYGIIDIPADIMPMSIHWLGNSSVATIPTLYDLVLKGSVDAHALSKGDIILFASVGAGMNINAVCYRC